MVVIGTGGLSHQLDGARAGFINKEFDLLCLDKLVAEPEALAHYSIHDWVKKSGSQGVEFLNWMAMRGAHDRTRQRAQSQLSHPDFQHRRGNGCLRKPERGRA